jgi:hypothetical protein
VSAVALSFKPAQMKRAFLDVQCGSVEMSTYYSFFLGGILILEIDLSWISERYLRDQVVSN